MRHDRPAELAAVALILREGVLLAVGLATATGIDRADRACGERGERFGLPPAKRRVVAGIGSRQLADRLDPGLC
jgi:hypothetical protein